MDALALVDTFGVLSPHAVNYFVRQTRERIKKPLETHFHSDFGMGVANTILALAAGAEVVHCTVTGIGERAGNASMEEIVLSLLTMYGIDVGMRYEKLHGLSRLVRELSGLQIPSNRPVVGEMLYDVESGIIANWVRNCGQEHILEVFPFHWELVGQKPPEIVLGKNSGVDSIRDWLDRIGVETSELRTQEILLKVKEKSLEKKGLLTEKEFRAIVEAVLPE
jgi:isopropylmalate/homocitrate/citramalate synthase